MNRLATNARQLLSHIHFQAILQLFVFVGVGLAATSLHFLVAILLIERAGMVSGWANLGGFLSALPVSFAGHALLTFRKTFLARDWRDLAAPAWKFGATAVSGFLVNQTLLYVFVERFGWPHRPCLLVILLFVAVSTFLLSRFWIFNRQRGRDRDIPAPFVSAAALPEGIIQRRWFVVVMLAAMVFGIWCRFTTLGNDALWADELYSWAEAHLPFQDLIWVQFDVHPPAYALVQKLFLGFGDAEWMLRLPSALFGLATVAVIVAMSIRRCGLAASLVGGAVVMLSEKHIVHSSNARNYAMALFLSVCASWVLMVLLQESRWSGAASARNRVRPLVVIGYVALTTAALMSHSFTVVYFIALSTTTLIVFAGKNLKSGAALAAFLALLNLPAYGLWALWYGGAQKTTSDFEWLPRFNPIDAARIFVSTIGPGGLPAITFVIACAIVVAGVVTAYRRAARPDITLITAMLIVFPIMLYGFSLMQPVYMERTLLMIIPGAGLAVAILTSHLAKPRWAIGVALLIVGLNGAASLHYVHRTKTEETYGMQSIQDFRGAMSFVAQNAKTGSAMLSCETFTEPATRYYYAGAEPHLVIGENGDIDELVGNWATYYGRPAVDRDPSLWLRHSKDPLAGLNRVIYLDVQMFCQGRAPRVASTLGQTGFARTDARQFQGIKVVVFDRSPPVPK